MTAAFGTRPKRRLNRVMDALNFEYPDYKRLDEGTEGVKRKRIVSILSRQAARMIKEDEKVLKKSKSATEPKVAVSKKRTLEAPEPKVTEATEETASTSPATEIAEILKVMTESIPFALISPLRLDLTSLLQSKETAPSTKEKAGGRGNSV